MQRDFISAILYAFDEHGFVTFVMLLVAYVDHPVYSVFFHPVIHIVLQSGCDGPESLVPPGMRGLCVEK